MSTRLNYSIIAATAAVSMATIGVFSRYSQLPPETLTFFRLALGAACLFVLLRVQRKSTQLMSAALWRSLLSGAFLAGFIVFYVMSMNHTTMANAIFMVYLGPVLATLLARVFRHQHLSGLQWGAMALALTGFVFMQQGVALDILNQGMIYATLAMACYGGFIFINGGLPAQADATVTAFWQLTAGAIVMLPIMLMAGQNLVFSMSDWGWLILVGFWPGFIALYCAIIALKHLPTGVYGTITYLEPVAVSIFGWVLFAEYLTAWQLFGGALIIVAGIGQAWLHSRPDNPVNVTNPPVH